MVAAAAAGYGSILSELTGNGWLGPSALAMTTTAAPYVASYLLQIPSLTSAAASTSSSSFSGSFIGTTNHAVAVNAMRDDAQGIGPFLAGAPTPIAPVAEIDDGYRGLAAGARTTSGVPGK